MIALPEPPAVNCQPRGGQDLILRVHLVPQHITLGKPGDCAICPWALAIREAAERAGLSLVEHDRAVKVFGDSANLCLDDGRWFVASCPPSVRAFVRRFDHGCVDPVHHMVVDLHFGLVSLPWEQD